MFNYDGCHVVVVCPFLIWNVIFGISLILELICADDEYICLCICCWYISYMQNEDDIYGDACMKNEDENDDDFLLNMCIVVSYVHAYISRILYPMKMTMILVPNEEDLNTLYSKWWGLWYICILRWRPWWRLVPHAYRVMSWCITYIQWCFKCVIYDMCSVNLVELCALVNLVKIGEYLMMWDCTCELLCSYNRQSLMMLNWLSVTWFIEN